MTRFAFLRPPRPLRRREVAVLALFGAVAIEQGWTGAVITHALPYLQTDLGLNDSQVFDLMASIRAASLVAIVFSWWGDHRGRRPPLVVALILLPVANLATGLATGALLVGGFQSLARIGTIAISGLALVVLAEEVGPEIRGYAVGVYALMVSVGTGIGLLLRPLGADGSWRLLFWLSAIPLAAIVLVIRRLRESRVFVPLPGRPPLAAVFREGHGKRFWPMAGLAFAVSAFTAPAANLALLRLENDLGWSPGGASLLAAFASAPGVILGVLAGGRMADTLGRRPTEVIAILLGVSGGLVFYLIDGGWIMASGIFVSNVGAFAFGPAFGAQRAELFPTHLRATATAWLVNASIIGGLAGFAAGRFVVDAWGIPATVSTLGLVLVATTPLVIPLPETKGLSLFPGSSDLDQP